MSSRNDDATYRRFMQARTTLYWYRKSGVISKSDWKAIGELKELIQEEFKYGLPGRFEHTNKLEEAAWYYENRYQQALRRCTPRPAPYPNDDFNLYNHNHYHLGDSTMQSDHSSKLYAQMNPNAFTVGIKFGEARYYSETGVVGFVENYHKEYTYATEYDLHIGELVLVETPRNGFAIGQVTRIDDFLDVTQFSKFDQLKWIVDVVNVDDYVATRHQLQQFDTLARKAHAAERSSKAAKVFDDFESQEAQDYVKQMRKLFK